MPSVLPVWLRVTWLCLAPFGLLFSARVGWEKTIWTWSRGPQTVGFSLMHIHPFLAIGGVLFCYLLMLWLIPAAAYLVKRRERISALDKVMVLASLFVAIMIMLPDTFFAAR